jgi:predicted RNA-binding protein with PIN domain
MLVLVDGYNVTMRDPQTSELSKEGMRESLVGRLRFSAGAVAPAGTIVVVFDARGELGPGEEERLGAVTVAYAPDADDEIVRRCAVARGQVAVVTDDMRLRARIAQDVGRHVEFRSAGEVTAAGLRASRQAKAPTPVAREEQLPEGADEITDELSKLWLSDEDR